VHGEEKPARALQEQLKLKDMHQTHYPDLHEGVDI
jgi:hypothetical protein